MERVSPVGKQVQLTFMFCLIMLSDMLGMSATR